MCIILLISTIVGLSVLLKSRQVSSCYLFLFYFVCDTSYNTPQICTSSLVFVMKNNVLLCCIFLSMPDWLFAASNLYKGK